jgi:hypothetical protein
MMQGMGDGGVYDRTFLPSTQNGKTSFHQRKCFEFFV